MSETKYEVGDWVQAKIEENGVTVHIDGVVAELRYGQLLLGDELRWSVLPKQVIQHILKKPGTVVKVNGDYWIYDRMDAFLRDHEYTGPRGRRSLKELRASGDIEVVVP